MTDYKLYFAYFHQVLPGGVAVSVLSELSPGGALMKGYSDQQLHRENSLLLLLLCFYFFPKIWLNISFPSWRRLMAGYKRDGFFLCFFKNIF